MSGYRSSQIHKLTILSDSSARSQQITQRAEWNRKRINHKSWFTQRCMQLGIIKWLFLLLLSFYFYIFTFSKCCFLIIRKLNVRGIQNNGQRILEFQQNIGTTHWITVCEISNQIEWCCAMMAKVILANKQTRAIFRQNSFDLILMF